MNIHRRLLKAICYLVLYAPMCLGMITIAAQPLYPAGDSVVVAVAADYDSVNKFHRFLFGEGYRKVWAAPVKLRVFDLAKEKGGLTIVREGGGLQTNSLRLRDKAGKEWVLRSIQKFPERGLPKNLRETVAKDILQDQVVTSHPFSALTVPPFAAALGIPHSNPEIVFVPDDPDLGTYRQNFGNTALLFEEREPVDTFKTDNTEKAQRKLESDNDYQADQRLVLRARLLDHLLGDWDRHEDQWRWEIKPGINNEVTYHPVPRDRDKVFYTTTGLFPWLLSHQWLKANLQHFDTHIRKVEEYNYNNRYFDRYFLNSLTEEDWKQEVAFVQRTITDSLIERAIMRLPDTAFALTGHRLIRLLKVRRSTLAANALDYYKFLSTNVDIVATDKNEHIDVEYKTSSNVAITITKNKKDPTRDRIIYQREFNPNDTKEIRLFGIGGTDVYNVTGSGISPIKIRLIGGVDVDSFSVSNRVKNRSNLYVYDHARQSNSLPRASQAKLRLANDSAVHAFDRKSFHYDHKGLLASVFYNPDQGVLLRAGYILEKQGFRKYPYASRQVMYANYATTWKSFILTYVGDFKKIVGQYDLGINLISRGPSNVDNFFGVGNETTFDNRTKNAVRFYQNRYDYVNGDVRLRRTVSPMVRLSAGLGAEFYTSSFADNDNKFLRTFAGTTPGEQVFSDQFFGGIVAGAEVNSRQQAIMPAKGIYWNTEIRAMQQWNGLKHSYARLFSDFSFYLPLKDSTIILANRVAGGTAIGKPGFFQQFKLGGPLNLRGYNLNRFTGKSVVYHNVELRMKLFDFTSYLLPGTIGLIGFNDLGRVWTPGEKSAKWHNGYGGGIYIVPAELILIQLLVGQSVENTQPYVSIGVRF